MNDSKAKEWFYGIIAEVAFYAFLYYVQEVFGVMGDLWANSLVLWALLNISIVFCPVVRKCCK